MSLEQSSSLPAARPWQKLIWVLAPLVVLGIALWWLIAGNLLGSFFRRLLPGDE